MNNTKKQLDEYRSFYHKEFSLPAMMRNNPVSSLYSGKLVYESNDNGFDYRTMLPFETIDNPIRLTNLIRKNESHIEYVNEGLIKTYPKEKLVSGYRKFCQSNLNTKLNSITVGEVFVNPPSLWNDSEKIVELTIEDKNRPGVVGFVLPFEDEPSDIIKKLVDEMYVYGWNLSDSKIVPTTLKRRTDKVDCCVIVFEEKFHEVEIGVDDVLYHDDMM